MISVSYLDAWPYFLIFSLFLYLIINVEKNGIKFHRYGNICFYTIFLFSICRYNIGADYQAYWNFVINNERDNYELLSQLFLDFGYKYKYPPIVFFLFSIVSLFPLKYFIKKYSVNPIISWYLYFTFPLFFFQDISTIRQAASIGMFMIAFVFVDRNKYLLSLVFVFLATLFHNSAIIALLVLTVPILKKSTLKINILLFILSFFVGNLVVTYITRYFSYYTAVSKFLTYIDYDFSGLNSLQYLIYFMIVVNFCFYKKLINQNIRNKLYITLVTLGGVLYNIFQIESQTARRFAVFFLLFELLIIPYYIKIISYFFGWKNEKISRFFLLLVLFLLQFYYIVIYIIGYQTRVITTPCFVPYDFWWNHI